jgi:hypothetical protein
MGCQLGARISGAELGAMISGAELAATLALGRHGTSHLGGMNYSVETCDLGAIVHDANPQGPNVGISLLRVQT